MAQVEGLRGVRYSLAGGCDISDRLAPPYDTISSEEQKKTLLARSEHNIVAIDLPHMPPREAGPEHLYRQAGELLERWITRNVMIRETEPASYLYRQVFRHAGRQYIRRGFIARLRLEPLGKGQVLPHEKTHSGPKEDRLLLSKFARSNLSQVFCLYEDPDNLISETLYAKANTPPTYWGELAGVRNEVWVTTDRKIQSWLTEEMSTRPVYIADGHHRYSTALMYRDYLAGQGALREDHPANYVSCMFVSMSEPGLLVLPTHRALLGLRPFSLEHLAAALADKFDHSWISRPEQPEELEEAVTRTGGQAFAFFNADEKRCLIVWPKEPASLLDDLAGEYSLAWRTLAVAILHSYILERVIYPRWFEGNATKAGIEYFSRADELVKFVMDTPGTVGAVVPPTPVEAVRQVCTDGLLMPQKSTYFYPKLATGLVINPLFD